jgi:hypothetical protein
MGCKNVGNSNRHPTIKKEKSPDFDFEEFRTFIHSKNSEKLFEVKAKLWEIVQVNNKATKMSLVSKYLFFVASGKFESRIKKRNGDEITIEGKLEKNGEIKLTKKQKVLENNQIKSTHYDGKIISSEKGMKCEGKVTTTNEAGEKVPTGNNFILDFTNNLWKLEYKLKNKFDININVFLRCKNNIYSGISFDESKGFSVWTGVEKNEIEDTILQQYLNSNETDPGASSYKYTGKNYKIEKIIEGTILNQELETGTAFKLKEIGKPYK